MYEVHIFSASAVATATNEGPYRPGDRHALIIMSRQLEGSDHNDGEAEVRASESGWRDFKFERAGTLIAENLNGKDRDFIEAFEYAMLNGCSVIAYSDSIKDDEET